MNFYFCWVKMLSLNLCWFKKQMNKTFLFLINFRLREKLQRQDYLISYSPPPPNRSILYNHDTIIKMGSLSTEFIWTLLTFPANVLFLRSSCTAFSYFSCVLEPVKVLLFFLIFYDLATFEEYPESFGSTFPNLAWADLFSSLKYILGYVQQKCHPPQLVLRRTQMLAVPLLVTWTSTTQSSWHPLSSSLSPLCSW